MKDRSRRRQHSRPGITIDENVDPRKHHPDKSRKRAKDRLPAPPSSSSSESDSDSSSSDESSADKDLEPNLKKSKRSHCTAHSGSDERHEGSGVDNSNSNNEDDLRKQLRRAQEEIDSLREQREGHNRKLADRSNQQNADSRKRKQSSSSKDIAISAEKQVGTGDKFTKEIESAGKHFAIQHHLFIDVKELRQVKITKKYSAENRFRVSKKYPDMEQQGIIGDLLELLPPSLAKKCRERKEVDEWILNQTKSAMSRERSIAVHRIRKEAGHKIFDCSSSLIDNDAERGEHAQLGARGLQAGAEDYFNVEVLHSNYSGKLDINTIFLNPLLIQAYSALVFGLESVNQVKIGQTPAPIVETSSAIWSLKEITPGAIAAASVLVLYAISPDTSFRSRGIVTGLDWREIHRQYFKYLWKGQIEKRSSVLNIFRHWNSILFPNLAGISASTRDKGVCAAAAEAALDEDTQELSDPEEETERQGDVPEDIRGAGHQLSGNDN